MNRPDARKCLFDVQEAGELILRFCAGKSFDGFTC